MGRRLMTAGLLVLLGACHETQRAPATAVMASGTDLESANPLVTIHPLSRQIQRHALFVTVVRFDSSLQAVPYFARAWQWAPDQRSVTFTLDSSLHWHDGQPTTARDVVFTFTAVRDAALGSPRRSEAAVIESVEATGAHTVRFAFQSPQSSLPNLLAELPLVPQHLLDTVPTSRWREHAFATAPVGNGPFRFVSRTPGRQWRFARNTTFPASMGGAPKLEQLVVAVVDEAATKFAGLVSGELDLAGVSPTMAHLVARDSSLALMTPPVLFSQLLAFNCTQAPFTDARVRRAISLAVHREQLVQAAVAGFATPARSAIPPGLPFSPAHAPTNAITATSATSSALEQYREDVHEADSLLEAAGWHRSATGGMRTNAGVPLRITLLTVGSGDMAVEQLIQADLSARGIGVEIRVLELASFLATVRAPDKTFDVVLTGIPGDISLGHLSALFDSDQQGGALDYTGFHNALLDTALRRARRAVPAAAAAHWATVDSVLTVQMPVAWLYHARGVQGRSRRLEHVDMDLRGELVSVSRWTRREEYP